MPLPYQALASELHVDHHEMEASPEDWLWLRHKSELKVGVSPSESAPFSIKTAENQYEGISADTTALVSQLLGVQLKLVPFANDEDAEQALIAGSIDLISSTHSQTSRQDLIFSTPYTQDRLAVFKRRSESRHPPANLAGLSVAVTREYVDELQQLYPRADFKVYSNHDKAIAAAAFGQADVYLDDLYSAYYQMNRSFYGYLSFERFSELSIGGYRYAFRGDNTRLQGLVNRAIVVIGKDQLRHLAMRWVGNSFIPREDPINLTLQESRWIERHPVVRLVVNDDLAPSAYFDSNGVFIGGVADLLEVITLSTGLHFQVKSYSGGFSQIINALQNGESDLTLMTASPEREEFLRFSRPLFVDPFVLLTNIQNKDKLVDLADKRVAIATGHVAIKRLHELYPKAILIEAGSTVNSMNLLYEGQVDAAVTALPAARYYIERLFRDKLVVSQALDLEPGTINFAYQRSDAELQSIIEKVLQSMAPDELNALYNRWRSPPGMSGQTWINYERVIRQVVLAAVVLLLLALVWVIYLRRQVKARAKAEQMLNDQLRFVETLTDCMPPPLYVCDSNGRMVSCNRSFLKSVGLSTEQVLNKTPDQLPRENFESAPEFHHDFLHAIRYSQTIESVHAIQLQGRAVWISHWVQPFQNSQGITKGVICGWLDITEHRQLVQQLQEAKSHADDASRAKSSFLATMSHEIRTPMNAVIGILELALKRADSAPIDRTSIEVAHTSAKSLLELIGDILDIARIESGRLSLSPKRTNLRELVESVARVFEGLARQKRLNLVLEIDSSINCDVLVDAMRFKQILSNLVSNAIKFTEEGTVEVSITGVLIDGSVLNVSLSVEDTGVGISPLDQQRLFRPFAQVHRNVQQTEGTGLGLVICRSLCEMMGGRLSMSSALGRGTKIDVELRLQVLERVSISPVLATPARKQRYRLQVLVVDDHQVNRQVLYQQLAFLGHDVSEAENGREGFERWREQPFDIVITDCHMPIMSGVELTRAIRRAELESEQESTVIIGLTADAQPEELELCILAGMNDCLIKPIGIDDLDARLLEHYLTDEVDQPETKQLISIPDSFKLVDLAPLELLISNEPIKFQQILDELIKSNRKDCQTMQELLQNGEIDNLVELAHRVKGAARVVKGEQLVECCRRLEAACQDSKVESGQLQQLVGQVEAAIAALEHALLSPRLQ
ncbi:transporter substrate-binding domain-containing protein [Pseudomonas sp. TH32]|uniref:transporter substrate-binding domain-containing protein n=1 Tax=Pseudomonas sp. TH32 TaxID=2796397 RepID=UPI001912B2D5|nr:transporter substrate-binding domain-containing protein [Pseudomonas sp. TH32]MBK5436001.1 transporter substrate-binding domain-containing protein [Pseudomonas sp. TH32]